MRNLFLLPPPSGAHPLHIRLLVLVLGLDVTPFGVTFPLPAVPAVFPAVVVVGVVAQAALPVAIGAGFLFFVFGVLVE